MKKIVFACVHNAGRSQMAAAFFNRIADPARATALSAGTRPAGQVHPEVVSVMREVGIDLAGSTPQRLTPELAAGAAWLITMGCGDDCPVVPGVRREDWPLPDPKGQPPAVVSAIRDDVRSRVEAFAQREGFARTAIIEGGRADVPEILAFIAANGLPTAGLADQATDLLVARERGRLIGTAALEIHGPDALLRSVAVDAPRRGTGLGQALTRASLDLARTRGVRRVFLLTETAPAFFPRFGFVGIERSQVPDSIRGTVEFASACPAGAKVMAVELT